MMGRDVMSRDDSDPVRSPKQFDTFDTFYVYYLSEHRHPMCRAMHYLGSALVLVTFILIIFLRGWQFLVFLPLIGYGFAWLGHALFEHNKPATFSYPMYSFMGDWRMFYQFIRRLVDRLF